MTKILITGGTGLIGRFLSEKLSERGYSVALLGRTRSKNPEIIAYLWDLEKGEMETEALENVDCIIHLAGANLTESKWSTKRRKRIVESRVKSTQLLFNKLKENKNQVKTFISASATGYYGAISTNKVFSETDPPASDFLGDTCREWEESVDRLGELGIRTVKIRTGVVLSKDGGALAKMLIPIKLGLGSCIGTGKQYLPWIHIEDLCDIYIKVIEDITMKGAYNSVAPDHKTNKDFTLALSRLLDKPLWLPNIPSVIIQLIWGKMSVILLKGSRVASDKIISSGYTFKFPNLEAALENLLNQNRK